MPVSMVEGMRQIDEGDKRRQYLLETTGCCRFEIDYVWHTWCYDRNCECVWKLLGISEFLVFCQEPALL
jgi:hypothetical protein